MEKQPAEAIVEIAGFQYKVKEQDTIKVPKLKANEGDTVRFPVLMLIEQGKNVIGTPYIKEMQCEAKVIGFDKGHKIIVYKYKSKKRYRRKKGHRQWYTEILINKITKVEKEAVDQKAAKPAEPAMKKPIAKKVAVQKPKAKKRITKKSPVKKALEKNKVTKKLALKKKPVKRPQALKGG